MHIAERMRRPYGQVKRLHVKALEKLRKQMELFLFVMISVSKKQRLCEAEDAFVPNEQIGCVCNLSALLV